MQSYEDFWRCSVIHQAKTGKKCDILLYMIAQIYVSQYSMLKSI